jgi:cell division protein FtsB
MNIRISYVCFVMLAILSVRAWIQSQDANDKLQDSRNVSTSTIVTGASEFDLKKEIDKLRAENADLYRYNQLTADVNSRITRVTLSFMALGAICYFLEERKRRKEPNQ